MVRSLRYSGSVEVLMDLDGTVAETDGVEQSSKVNCHTPVTAGTD